MDSFFIVTGNQVFINMRQIEEDSQREKWTQFDGVFDAVALNGKGRSPKYTIIVSLWIYSGLRTRRVRIAVGPLNGTSSRNH